MPRGYSNYSFVIDSSFQPFTMQEMLTPFLAYKEEFDKAEAAYTDLKTKADKFKYLAGNLDPESKAAQIYNGYADELNAQANDFAKHGLHAGNRRGLTSLRQRYQGEIGRLYDAYDSLKKEQELRRQLGLNDSSMLYSDDNLNIDKYLDGKAPNLYSVSGNELYAKGAVAGKAASSRIYSNPEVQKLDAYYNNYFNEVGYSPEKMQEFRNNLAAIPELQQAALDIAKANRIGELGEGSTNYEAALQQIINGIADGVVYQRVDNVQRNLGQMTAAESAADARARESASRAQQQMELSALQSGYKRENGKWVLDEEGIKKRAEMMGIGSYNPDEWEIGPDGKPKRKPKTSETKTEEDKIKEEKNKALLKLDKSTLKNEKGFDVNVGNDRQHYDYIGALVHNPDQNKWYSGQLGEDYGGHKGIALWSDINVVDRLGNYSVTRCGDKAERRVLSQSEIAALSNNPDIANKIEDEIVKSNLFTEKTIEGVMSEHHLSREKAIELLQNSGYTYISDYQLVAVKNDNGDDDYLIAIRTK